MRDLTDEPDEAVAAERSRVASEGWGAELSACRHPTATGVTTSEHGWMTTTDALRS